MTAHAFYRTVIRTSGDERRETAKRGTAAVFHALRDRHDLRLARRGHLRRAESPVRQAVSGWRAAHLPRVRPGRDLLTRVALAPGSSELRSIFARGPGATGASGCAPLSPTEDIVLGVYREDLPVLSHRLAQLIHACRPELLQVHVHLAARIGEPVDSPWVGIQVVLPDGRALPDVDAAIRAAVGSEIERLPQFRSELIRGAHLVC
jgi:S-adenosylmethionine synthetase